MNRLFNKLALLLTAASIASCGSQQIEVPPSLAKIPPPTADTDHFEGPIVPGDVIEITYFRNTTQEKTPYRILPGDVLSVRILDHVDLSSNRLLVLPDGSISPKGMTRVAASGKTVTQLTAQLAEFYKAAKIRDPKVTVSVIEADKRIDALLSDSGGSRNLVITVDPKGYIDLPFIGPVLTGQPLRKIQDQIHLSYKAVFGGRLEVIVNLRKSAQPLVYILGEVGKPGNFPYLQPFTPLMAIAAAGGFLATADSENLQLFRLGPNGKLSVRPLSLRSSDEVAVAEALQSQLQPNDVVFVPKTGVALANQVVEQYIRNMIPAPIGFGLGYDLNSGN